MNAMGINSSTYSLPLQDSKSVCPKISVFGSHIAHLLKFTTRFVCLRGFDIGALFRMVQTASHHSNGNTNFTDPQNGNTNYN